MEMQNLALSGKFQISSADGNWLLYYSGVVDCWNGTFLHTVVVVCDAENRMLDGDPSKPSLGSWSIESAPKLVDIHVRIGLVEGRW